MKTDFFSKIKHFLEGRNLSFTMTQKDERISVSVSFINTDNQDEVSSPIIISGTESELEDGFIQALSENLNKVDKVIGLSVDTTALDKEVDEKESKGKKSTKKAASKKAVVKTNQTEISGDESEEEEEEEEESSEESKEEKKPAYKGKPLDQKAKDGLAKVDEYIKDEKYDHALVHLKSSCEKHIGHPDVIAKRKEVEELIQKQEEEESKKAEEHKEVTAPAVESASKEDPVKEEPKTLANAFSSESKSETINANSTSMQEKKVEAPKAEASNEEFDKSKYKSMSNLELVAASTKAQQENNIKLALNIINLLLENSPGHPVATMRKKSYEATLNS